MVQTYKIDEVKSIKDRLNNAKSIVLIDYKGINIAEVNELRNRMRDADVDYFISKNTFIKLALNELGIKDFDEYLSGPTAVAISKVDEVAAARELAKFKKNIMADKKFPKFKIGIVDDTVMDIDQLEKLAELPSKEVLLSMVLQGFNAPITGFVAALGGILRKFIYAIDTIAKEKEKK
ncbi:MAG: 50S ribosomal protein L10 [Candidatus Cloacimonetes bacterium]|nr:50S ribosomal protein L10 [Candidatus Cloacimonadota bacterium]